MISLAIFALCWAIGCAAAAMLLLSPTDAPPQESEKSVSTLR